ncbi:hypothetical protein DFP73DRAFT_634404 [Morchella snyderi]|nr:hypothetical protein DFP73DRAFT_634404 [Morchella snyderi]
MSPSTTTGESTAGIANTDQMTEGTSNVNSSESINSIQTTSVDAVPSLDTMDQSSIRTRGATYTNSIAPLLIGSHLASGAFGDLQTPLLGTRLVNQLNTATSTATADVRNLQRRLATVKVVQDAARIFTISPLSYDGCPPQSQPGIASDELPELLESIQRWNHFDTAAMVGEIMRATADIETLNSALLAMRMTGVADSMPTPTQITNAVSAAAFLDAVGSVAVEIGAFQATYGAHHTVMRLGGVVHVIPASHLNSGNPMASMVAGNMASTTISATASVQATPSDPSTVGLSAAQLNELNRLHNAMVAVLPTSIGHFRNVPPTPPNSISAFSTPPSRNVTPSPSESSSANSEESLFSSSRPNTPVNSIVDLDAELMASLEGLPPMVCVLVLELVVEHNMWSKISAEIACSRAGYNQLPEWEGGDNNGASVREEIWEKQEEFLELARGRVRCAQEELLKEDGEDQWVSWQRDYYLTAI